jgi:fatty acid CoA ligase FadD32
VLSISEAIDDGCTDSPLESLLSSLARLAQLDRAAYTEMDYREDRAGVAHTLTWSQVNQRVMAVAEKISELASPSDRVAILCPQDLSYPIAFLGALAAGTIAVPLFAPEATSHAARLSGALADCEPSVWLTTEAALGSVEQLIDDPRVPRPTGVIAVDAIDPEAAGGFEPVAADLGTTAYLQYTSGSTREPAGAVITHGAVATNIRQCTAAFELNENTTLVGWLPFFHDMGLLLAVCAPVAVGSRSVFMTPFDFVQRPKRWLDQLAGHRNVITAAPNFAFEYAIDRLSDEDRSTLDLSGVVAALNGAEPIRARTIERFQEAFGPCGFAPEAHRPSYGLAEATVFVSTSRPGSAPKVTSFNRAMLMAGHAVSSPRDVEAIRLVSAGGPVGQHVCIVDPADRTARPDGEVGEVWVNGGNVADGYWGQAERSDEEFDAHLIGGGDELPVTGWLRTGDLGVRHDGELYITGRLKDVIIIDGKNHYPQDIEETVQEAHPAVRAGRVAAFGIPTREGEAIVIVLERERGEAAAAVAPEEISKAVRRAVAGAHDLKLRDVQVLDGSKVLRTSSGKIARSANRERYVAERAAR